MEKKRIAFLEKGFELFSEKGIAVVSMKDVAKAAGYGVATLYRYFSSKPVLVIAIAVRKWSGYLRADENIWQDDRTAAQRFTFFLDSFLELYRNHRALLRFNQFFNIYLQTENIGPDVLQPYQNLIESLAQRFHRMYLMAEKDHTLRLDTPEEEMFSLVLHMMLAAVTRYAVGLVYQPYPGYDPESELVVLRNMFLEKYCC